jgi:hypothetical protein
VRINLGTKTDPDWQEPTIWELLEQDAPKDCEAIQDLYSWSMNYDPGKGPMTLFLDLIGWSQDNIGEPLYNLADASLGYVELGKLADALSAYADCPSAVIQYVDELLEAEGRE